jgi:hypothetical protein
MEHRLRGDLGDYDVFSGRITSYAPKARAREARKSLPLAATARAVEADAPPSHEVRGGAGADSATAAQAHLSAPWCARCATARAARPKPNLSTFL